MPTPPTIASIATGGDLPTSTSIQGLAAQSLLPLPALPTTIPSQVLLPYVTSRTGLILSLSADPIPYRLVQRIQSGEFVEMRDLLADNVSLHAQLEDLHGQAPFVSTPMPFRPRLREIPSLTSWTYCFLAYAAVRSRDPQTRDLLAYCSLLIREALRHGGSGWQEYDRSFRRQAAINMSIQWNTLQPGLQPATLVGSGGTPGVHCHICREPDHSATQMRPRSSSTTCAPGPIAYRTSGPATAPRRISRPPRRPESLLGICASWNRGVCAFPGRVRTNTFVEFVSLAIEGSSALRHQKVRTTTGLDRRLGRGLPHLQCLLFLRCPRCRFLATPEGIVADNCLSR